MKVCVLTTSFPRHSEGDRACGHFINSLTQAIADEIDIKIIAPHTDGAKIAERFGKVEVFRFRYFFPISLQKIAYGEKGIIENLKNNHYLLLQVPFFLFSFLIKTWKISRHCDLIHANWIVTGFMALIIKKTNKIPVVLTVHNSQLRHFPRWLSKYVIKNVDWVISPHPELTQIVRSFGKNELTEIPNMIDFKQFEREIITTHVKKEFGIKNEHVITYVARLVDWKDPITFIKSIPHVLKKTKNIKFLLVGSGPLNEQLKQEIRRLKIEDRVIMTGSRDDILSILKISNIFAALSPVENIWSMTILEAIFSGIPCIITKAGSTEQILSHKINAFLIPPKNEKALADGIITLLEHKELRNQIAYNALALMKQNGVNEKTIITNTIKTYNNIMKRAA